MKTVDFSETIAACDLKVGRCRQLIEIMKVLILKVKVISLPYTSQILYVLCFTRPRYQLSVYRTLGPLVYHIWVWRPSCSCDPDATNKLLFLLPMQAPHKIWL